MAPNSGWLFIDDEDEAAKAFAEKLAEGDQPVSVELTGPASARDRLLTGATVPLGVLMDVDLSGTAGEHGTGLGIAQDIRAKQKAGEITDFPIVRFARPEPVAKNIGGDPASEDLFDLKIDKTEVARDRASVQRKLHGARGVYEDLFSTSSLEDEELSQILGLAGAHYETWSHPALHSRLADGRQAAVHVVAGMILRYLIHSPGLLIDENLLAFRLGLDRAQSGEAWERLLGEFGDFTFRGAGHEAFTRWWARGLDAWWTGAMGSPSLASLTITERHAKLQRVLQLENLSALTMPRGSPGERPWRLCSLSLEITEPQYVPVDPAVGVRLTPRIDPPIWVDPAYASFGVAVRNAHDLRLNRSDLDRLRLQIR